MAAAAAASRAGQPARAAALARSALANADPVRAAHITPAAVTYLIEEDRPQEAIELAERALVVLDADDAPTPDRARLLAELRSVHNLVANRFYAGALEQAAGICGDGIDRARATGVLWTGYGVGMLIFRSLIRYTRGDLAPAPPNLDWVPESATWILSVVDLYAAVARGDADVITRGRAVKADWRRDPMPALISGGCTIDALTWTGDQQAAVDLTLQIIAFMEGAWNDYFLGGIWLSALGLTALVDRAEQMRLAGGDPSRDIDLGGVLLERAVETARRGRPRGGRLGPEGRAWMSRARAEHGRLLGDDDPARWAEVALAFGYGYRYEVARSSWRRATALVAAGDHPAARSEAVAALVEAVEMGARPLAEAIRDLGRRARLNLPGSRPTVGVLTDREEAVLRLVATGMTNRQVGERLFISGKAVSVHMSNLLAKLGVTRSRRSGLRLRTAGDRSPTNAAAERRRRPRPERW